MTETRRYHDTIVIGAGTNPATVDLRHITSLAREVLAERYPRSTLVEVDWTFARTVEEVEAWPLPHDCDNCREGKTKAALAVMARPGSIVALGDMTCEEPVRG